MSANSTQKHYLAAAKDLAEAQFFEAQTFVKLHFNGVPNPNEQLTVALMQILATNYAASIHLAKP